jgi:hypothetical protein
LAIAMKSPESDAPRKDAMRTTVAGPLGLAAGAGAAAAGLAAGLGAALAAGLGDAAAGGFVAGCAAAAVGGAVGGATAGAGTAGVHPPMRRPMSTRLTAATRRLYLRDVTLGRAMVVAESMKLESSRRFSRQSASAGMTS